MEMDDLSHRRDFLKTVGLGALSLAAPGCAGRLSGFGDPATMAERPNIVFIMLDDLGPEWIGCCGGEDADTPNIDRLAREGMRFTSVYSMPKCTPTRASLLTGQYPFRTGWVNHWDVPRWGCGCHFDWKHNPSFARVMQDAGYATAAAGKWQINDFRIQPDAMERHGFDDYCMWTGYESGNKASAKRYHDPYVHTKKGSATVKGGFGDTVFTDFLIDFMKRNRAGPMMLYYPMCLTHGPFTATPIDPHAEGKTGKFRAMVRYADHLVGRLVEAIDNLGIREKTIVIVTADNGSPGGLKARMNGRDVKGGKGKMLESGARVPFIVCGPGLVPAGVTTDALADFTDMLPTFAALGGAKLPDGAICDGRSMADLIRGRADDSSREWIMAMGGGVARVAGGRVVPAAPYADRVVRGKRFKLWIEGGRSTRLFDLRSDPAEEKNLIASLDPGIAAARQELEEAVASFPPEDGTPRYDPLPPQAWDSKPGWNSKGKRGDQRHER